MDNYNNVFATPLKRKLVREQQQQEGNNNNERRDQGDNNTVDVVVTPSPSWEEVDANADDCRALPVMSMPIGSSYSSWPSSSFASPSKKRKITVDFSSPPASPLLSSLPLLFTTPILSPEKPLTSPPAIRRRDNDLFLGKEEDDDISFLAFPSFGAAASGTKQQHKFVLPQRTTSVAPRSCFVPIPKRLFELNSYDYNDNSSDDEDACFSLPQQQTPRTNNNNNNNKKAERLFPSLRMRPSKRRYNKKEMMAELELPTLAEIEASVSLVHDLSPSPFESVSDPSACVTA
uniref:Uncharacterized protein n=1 Tax=Pseudo-nitzschia australis TaxID=44445 RepID=A0A6U9XBK8_9STRA|mmetsp:Transcript_15482/g.33419  ORF Transcript_15482/g.33419 Transcript_15482/m.33419 type:complete len:289 (+) Transcript_15482:226-1092(+)